LTFTAAGYLCSPPVDQRTIQRWFKDLAHAIKEKPILNPNMRFMHLHPSWPMVTAQVDCTTVACRHRHTVTMEDTESDADGNVVSHKKDQTYSGKHRDHVWKFEVWTTHQGLPVAFRGPVFGSIHDAKVFHGAGEPFFHFEGELFLADGGYQGCGHCLVPVKKGVRNELTADQRRFNRHHRLLRSRVERTFAWLDKFRIMAMTDHDKDFMGDAMLIILSVTFLTAQRSRKYEDAEDALPSAEARTLTRCWCMAGCAVAPKVTPAQLLEWAAKPQFAEEKPTTKPPRKSARPPSANVPAATPQPLAN
jgi:hypothetical protein